MEARERGAERLHLLRVLVAVAWADGVISPTEVAYLQGFCDQFGLPAVERDEIMALTRTPIGRDGFQTYLRSLGDLQRDPEARVRLLELAAGLVDADQVRTPEETRVLELLRESLGDEPPAAPSHHPWSGIWSVARSRIGEVKGRLAPGSLAALLEQAVRERMPGAPSAQDAPLRRRHQALLFGALLFRVIRADQVTRPEELERLRGILEGGYGFSGGELDQMLTLIETEICQQSDRQRLCAEYNRITEMDDRLRLLGALFAVGLADGVLSPSEEEEIRLISNFLWIETQEYVRVRKNALAPGPRPE